MARLRKSRAMPALVRAHVQPATTARTRHVRTVLLCGLASFIFLLAAAVDPAWVTSKQDTQYTTPSGPKTGQAVSHFGLSAAVATAPTFDDDAKAEYDITLSIPSGPAMQQINTQNKAFDGPTASSGDTAATGVIPLALALIAIAMLCTGTRYLAGSDCCSPTCGCVMHWASGVCAVLGGVLALVGVITFATAGIEEALCWQQEQNPNLENASCGYGGAFAVAIVGAIFALAQGGVFFFLLKLDDVTAVKEEGQVKSSNPLSAV